MYFPWETPSNFSSSAWSTHCRVLDDARSEIVRCKRKVAAAGLRAAVETCLAGEVELDGLDADVGGTRSHGWVW